MSNSYKECRECGAKYGPAYQSKDCTVCECDGTVESEARAGVSCAALVGAYDAEKVKTAVGTIRQIIGTLEMSMPFRIANSLAIIDRDLADVEAWMRVQAAAPTSDSAT